MTMWPDRRETREQLARIEKNLRELQKRMQDMGGALKEERTVREALQDRVAQCEQHVDGIGARSDTRFAELRESMSGLGSDVRVSFTKVGKALKRVIQTDKRVMTTLGDQMRRLVARLARVNVSFDPSVDARFIDVAHDLVETRRTMLGYDRLFTLWQAAANVAPLDLPAVEVGTFKGGSAALLAEAFRTFAGGERELHIVDTFEGHLDATFSEHDPDQQRGKFQSVVYEEVRDYLAKFARVHVHKGDASLVVRQWPERQYSLVHLDVDLFRPTLDCLEYFGPRLVDGGIIVMDDYEAPSCPGISRAAQEYLARNRQFQMWRLQAEQLVLIKGAISASALPAAR